MDDCSTLVGDQPLSAEISVVGPSPAHDHVVAATGFTGGITDDCLLSAHHQSLAVIKAALLLLTEYRTLVNPVPDINVEAGGDTVSLETLLELAEDAASIVAWTHIGG